MRWALRTCCKSSGGGETSRAEYSTVISAFPELWTAADFSGELVMRVRSIDYHRHQRCRVSRQDMLTAKIHQFGSSSCRTILDFSVSIVSTASPLEKLLLSLLSLRRCRCWPRWNDYFANSTIPWAKPIWRNLSFFSSRASTVSALLLALRFGLSDFE